METLNHNERNWMPAYATTIQVATSSLLAVRLFSRFQGRGGALGFDDVFIALAWVLATADIVCILIATTQYGLNKHMWDLSYAQIPVAIEYSWIIAMLFLWSTCFTKISVLMFYRRLVDGTYSSRLKLALWSALAFVVLYTIGLFIYMLNMCHPLEAVWGQYDPNFSLRRHYSCISQPVVDRVSLLGGILSVVTDFYSVTLPGILLLKVRLSRRQRLGLFVIFGLGYFTVVAGIFRTIYLAEMQNGTIDKTWTGFNTVVAGIAEGNIGIICACAPSLHSVFGHYFRRQGSTTGSKITGQSGSYTTQSTRETGPSSRPSRTPNSWMDSKSRSMQHVEAYDWHQKDNFSDNKSDSIGKLRPPVFSEFPSRNRSGGLGGEPQTFLHGATDDEDNSESYAY